MSGIELQKLESWSRKLSQFVNVYITSASSPSYSYLGSTFTLISYVAEERTNTNTLSYTRLRHKSNLPSQLPFVDAHFVPDTGPAHFDCIIFIPHNNLLRF